MASSNISSPNKHLPVVIIGTGFGGIALAVALKKAGIEDFTILERASEVGGTWRDNTYPGCACDVASNLYSFSFAPNPNWSRTHSNQPEIFEYLKKVARDFNVYPHIRFKQNLQSAVWNSKKEFWEIETSNASFTCDVLVTAVGPFGDAVIPDFPGKDTFKGKAFHTLHWDKSYDISGKKVAVIGTGATGVQIVPELQKAAKKLTVFQRTPSHILPRVNIETSPVKRMASRYVPFFQRGIRAMWYTAYEGLVGLPQFVDPRFLVPYEATARYHLYKQIKDQDLRDKLTPNYRFGCKRPVFSSEYFPALQQNNVDLVCDGIQEIREHSIVDTKGVEHDVDTIVYATGFRIPHQIGEKLVGNKGETLSEFYAGKPTSFMGTSVSGFPNLFMMLGPFSAAGNQSAIFMLETQAGYISKAIVTMRKNDIKQMDVREDVLNAFSNDIQERSLKTTWVSGGCTSYFQNAEGGNNGLWPNWSFMHRWKSRTFDTHKYNVKHNREVEDA